MPYAYVIYSPFRLGVGTGDGSTLKSAIMDFPGRPASHRVFEGNL